MLSAKSVIDEVEKWLVREGKIWAQGRIYEKEPWCGTCSCEGCGYQPKDCACAKNALTVSWHMQRSELLSAS